MTDRSEEADRSIRDVGHDAGRARLLRTSLKVFAEGHAGPELQEMARDVLAGRTSLREALLSSAYSGALRRQAEQGMRQLNEMSAEERDAVMRAGREALASMAKDEQAQVTDEPDAWRPRPPST